MLKALMLLVLFLSLLLSSLLSSCLSTSASRQAERSGSENAVTESTAGEEGAVSSAQESRGEGEEIAQRKTEKPAAEKEESANAKEAKPAEEPKQIPNLTIGQIRRRLKVLIKPPVYQVTINNLALIRLEDLNLDGTPEILVPCVKIEGDDKQDVDTDRLSDFSSLFGQEDLSFPFYLYLFQMEERGPVLAKTISLGSRVVYGGMAKVQIIQGKSVPFVIVVKFQTQEGVEQEWLVFNGESIVPISRLSLNETFSSKLLTKFRSPWHETLPFRGDGSGTGLGSI